jgi:hypothetical protein
MAAGAMASARSPRASGGRAASIRFAPTTSSASAIARRAPWVRVSGLPIPMPTTDTFMRASSL